METKLMSMQEATNVFLNNSTLNSTKLSDIKARDYYHELGMNKPPFRSSLNEEQILMTHNLVDAYSRLTTAVHQNMFAVLVGDPGLGKTTLLRLLANNLSDQEFQKIYLSQSQVTPQSIYRECLTQLNVTPCNIKSRNKALLDEHIRAITSAGRKVVLLIDEAHHMNSWNTTLKGNSGLEEMRFLMNNDFDQASPLSVILCGQKLLLSLLAQDVSEAVLQRIDMTCELKPMAQSDMSIYVQKHLEACGLPAGTKLFSDEALSLIYTWSQGRFRLINKICVHCLFSIVARKVDEVTEELVNYVINNEMLHSKISGQ